LGEAHGGLPATFDRKLVVDAMRGGSLPLHAI
jgi:hypothetical protein